MKTLARHIACGVADLSKLRCNGCEIDHPSQRQHDCLLPDYIVIDMHFDVVVEKAIFFAYSIADSLRLKQANNQRSKK